MKSVHRLGEFMRSNRAPADQGHLVVSATATPSRLVGRFHAFCLKAKWRPIPLTS